MNAQDAGRPLRYLLGEMTAAEQDQFEERFFHDVELSERLADVENDLVDAYVRGDLSNDERDRFERHYLVSERRREKVELALALFQLQAADATSPEVSGHTPPAWWKMVFAGPRVSRIALAMALAAALLLVLGGWWLFAEVRQLRGEVTRLAAERDTASQQNEQLRAQLAEQKRQSQELSAQNQPTDQQVTEPNKPVAGAERESKAAAAFLTFTLLPGTRGDEGQRRLSVPPSARTIRFRLSLRPGDDYATYQVTLETASGRLLRRWNNLKATAGKGAHLIFVDVPTALLDAGEYEAALSGVANGHIEPLGYYSFGLKKE